jgi:DNA-binding beta-propeller fold protein YncE
MAAARRLKLVLLTLATLTAALSPGSVDRVSASDREQRFLYVASPGIRNYVEHGGVGILVFDIDRGYRFVKRIPSFESEGTTPPENVKGIVASAKTGRLYITTPKRLVSFDLMTEKVVWNRTYDYGCDRMALSPDGRLLYVPSFEGPHWLAIDALSGDVVARVVTDSGSHNTVYGTDGKRVYLAGLRSPFLSVVDPATHQIVSRVGPFGNSIRPFTVNAAQTLCFVNVNDLLGFEIGDLKTGKMLHRVEVTGHAKGPVKRHGCPSHGVGLTPDESEIWVVDAANSAMHVFDATAMPPRQVATIKLRDQPGWITFSLDGRHAYPSTGEIVDVKTRKVIATLTDETGRAVQSEKVVEIVFANGRPVRTGDQFGIGRKPVAGPTVSSGG